MAYRSANRFDPTKWLAFIAKFKLSTIPTYTMRNTTPLYYAATRFCKIFKKVGI